MSEYPSSRIGITDQCKVCPSYKGTSRNRGYVELSDGDGGTVELLRWTCDTCGHTHLFASGDAKDNPRPGESFPV